MRAFLGHRAGRYGLALAVLFTATVVQAQEAAQLKQATELDQKIIAAAKDGSQILANLTYLSDVIGPRVTGSAALKRANDWTAGKMKEYGLANAHMEAWSI